MYCWQGKGLENKRYINREVPWCWAMSIYSILLAQGWHTVYTAALRFVGSACNGCNNAQTTWLRTRTHLIFEPRKEWKWLYEPPWAFWIVMWPSLACFSCHLPPATGSFQCMSLQRLCALAILSLPPQDGLWTQVLEINDGLTKVGRTATSLCQRMMNHRRKGRGKHSTPMEQKITKAEWRTALWMAIHCHTQPSRAFCGSEQYRHFCSKYVAMWRGVVLLLYPTYERTLCAVQDCLARAVLSVFTGSATCGTHSSRCVWAFWLGRRVLLCFWLFSFWVVGNPPKTNSRKKTERQGMGISAAQLKPYIGC